jgi:hypothetical protein
MRVNARLALSRVVTVVRWWFGLTYLLSGIGLFIAGPVMIGIRNDGGVYMLIGGPIIAALGWAIHPWGLQRSTRRLRMLPLRQ